MCGIAGILRFDDTSPERPRLETMQRHLLARGPDGRGVEVDGPCGLAHTRLSVIDLLGGHQPMTVPAARATGGLTLVFNGEIYNHRQLRRRLEQLGHQFTTDHCDTEVLLHGYRQWGEQLPKHLQGMFAFAVWDAGRRQLLLVRDRVGKKPLYLHRDERGMTFGSVIGSVLAGLDRTPAINRAAMSQFLTFGYTGEQSLIEGLAELPAAHTMRVTANGQVELAQYWRPPPLSRTSTSLGAAAAMREVLVESVNARLESDVPLGCFLSGGIDSSLVAAIARQQLGDERLKTFSVSMPDARYDEAAFARRVADHIGAEHHELRAEADIAADLERLIATMGEPFADSSLLPTYWLSRATREHVKVALSGDGGDELFGGYDRYRAMRLLARHRWWIGRLPAGVLPGADGKSVGSKLSRLVRAARPATPGTRYAEMVRLFSPRQIGRLGIHAGPVFDEPSGWHEERDEAEAARRWDLAHYLPFDLLRKVDRASMTVALEVRCPLLDTQVCDLAGHLPLRVLMPGGRAKGLLREVASEWLPRDIVRRKKMGFAVPIGEWFRGELHGMLRRRLLEDDALKSLGCAPAAVAEMIDEHQQRRCDHTHRLFALLTLAVWRRWLDDPQPAT